MATSVRDRTVGAGYDYQWDVALFFLLKFVIRDAKGHGELVALLNWLGSIAGVTLEGTEATYALEDFTLRGEKGRELQIQVKESNEDANRSPWRKTSKKFLEFMKRAARRPYSPERRVLFLTSGSVHEDIRKLLGDRALLADFHAKHVKNEKDGDKDNAPVPELEASIAAWQQVRVSQFLDATPVDANVASLGIGSANVGVLVELNVRDPEDAYQRLWRQVARWSFRAGGTTMSSRDLHAEFRRLLGLSLQAPGSRLMSLDDRLRLVPQDFPSRATFDEGHVWIDDVRASQALDLLRDTRLALIVGGAGTGKTVLSRTIGVRMINDGWWPIYWDFEHLGPFPHTVGEVWRHASATAQIGRLKPMVLLENVHLAAVEFAGILAQLELDTGAHEPMIVLATARTKVRVAPSMEQRLDAAVIDLTADAPANAGMP